MLLHKILKQLLIALKTQSPWWPSWPVSSGPGPLTSLVPEQPGARACLGAMCIPSKFVCWQPSPLMGWYLEVGLPKVIKFRWDPRGSPVRALVSLWEENETRTLSFPLCKDTIRCLHTRKRAFFFYRDRKSAPWSWTSKPAELWEIKVWV